jgi:hypothetical protein
LLNQKKLRRDLKKELRIELLILKLQKNSLSKDYLLALAQDPDNLVELMVTFYKENNYSSTQRKLIKERNDFI